MHEVKSAISYRDQHGGGKDASCGVISQCAETLSVDPHLVNRPELIPYVIRVVMMESVL